MKELLFKIIDKQDIDDELAKDFIKLLVKQDKVYIPNKRRIQSCEKLVLCYADQELVGIGAIKTATTSVFDKEKANLKEMRSKVSCELGYFYVDCDYRGFGISNTMTRLLLQNKEKDNIIASTELYPNNVMIKVLEKFGFRQFGKPWPSKKHDGTLGLFIRFKIGEKYTTKD